MSPPVTSPERKAEIIRRWEAGEGPRSISRALGISHNITAGVLHRHRHGSCYARYAHPKRFRDEQRVREAVQMADSVGLMAACRALKIDQGQLSRWRQALRAKEVA